MSKAPTKPKKPSAYDSPEIKDLPEIRADKDTHSDASDAPVLPKGSYTDPISGIKFTHN